MEGRIAAVEGSPLLFSSRRGRSGCSSSNSKVAATRNKDLGIDVAVVAAVCRFHVCCRTVPASRS